MNSIGLALTDTLDDLISDERIDPQLAMKILTTFDEAMTLNLQSKVKARLTFKVCRPNPPRQAVPDLEDEHAWSWVKPGLLTLLCRGASIHIDSVTRSGPFSSKMLPSRWRAALRCRPTR